MPRAYVKCANTSCTAKHPADKWSSIHANSAGWFAAKNGDSFCPEHVPAWVPAWRAKVAAFNSGGPRG